MTYDPETDTLFIGTGNGGPWNQKIRSPGGDANLFLCSIVALDAKTGKYKWHYQVNPGETWDYNAVRQKAAWRVPTAGGLVFQGQGDGRFVTYDATSGAVLWQFNAQGAVLAPPLTYRAGGRQYVTVLSGNRTSGAMFGVASARFGWEARQPRRVLTFALDGKATVPPAPQPYRPVAAVDKEYRADARLADAGNLVYHHQCHICHGMGAVAAGIAPDLRASPIPSSAEAFDAVVRQGALIERGMPRFDQLDDTQMAALRQYIRSRAFALVGDATKGATP